MAPISNRYTTHDHLTWLAGRVPQEHLTDLQRRLCALRGFHGLEHTERLWRLYLDLGGDPEDNVMTFAIAYHDARVLPNRLAASVLSIDLWIEHSDHCGRDEKLVRDVAEAMASTARTGLEPASLLADLYLFDIASDRQRFEQQRDLLRRDFWSVSDQEFMAETVRFFRCALEGDRVYASSLVAEDYEHTTRSTLRSAVAGMERLLGTTLHTVAFN